MLVVVGTSSSYFYSVSSLLRACRTGDPAPHVFFETSAMLITFVTLGAPTPMSHLLLAMNPFNTRERPPSVSELGSVARCESLLLRGQNNF